MLDAPFNVARFEDAPADDLHRTAWSAGHKQGWLNGFMFGAVLMLCSCAVVGLMVAGHFRVIG